MISPSVFAFERAASFWTVYVSASNTKSLCEHKQHQVAVSMQRH